MLQRLQRVVRLAALRLAPSLQFLPESLRKRLFRMLFPGRVTAAGHAAQPWSPATCALPYGVNLAGCVTSELGIGESVRRCAASCEAAGLPFAMLDVSAICYHRKQDTSWTHKLVRDPRYAVNVVHVNAPEVAAAGDLLGAAFFEGRYTIACWNWELPELPDDWLPGFAPFHEIWTPTEFVRRAVAGRTEVPVRCFPHAVSFAPSAQASRARFGLPADAFLFLCMYDMRSTQLRKNPEGAVEAFRAAFPRPGTAAALVVKVQNSGFNPARFRALRECIADRPDILLLDITLSRQEVYDLESVCDAFVSLHRAEGFGLALAECMYLGKPVVATNWSGNADFMNEGNSCPVRYALRPIEAGEGPYRAGQSWAEPDVAHAAAYLQRLVSDAAYREALGRAAQAAVRAALAPAVIGRGYRARLAELGLHGPGADTP
jgi:glycosyltransferase involved in cell wall biosynthesis